MEISKMLTVSSAHITESTSKLLDNEEQSSLSVYKKEIYGWFIYLNIEDIEQQKGSMPEELYNLIALAVKHECSIVCIDHDGTEIEELPTFEW